MKKSERVVLQRERLYAEAWKTPIRRLAKKYGMSDVGLAKVCRRMDIPLPPRGYWAKHAYGHRLKKQPLPALKEKAVAQVALNKSEEELLQIARNRFCSSKVRHRERQRIHRLQGELRDWENGQRIRAYVAAMRSSGRDIGASQAEFLAWAETYADHLDPTVDFRIAVLDAA